MVNFFLYNKVELAGKIASLLWLILSPEVWDIMVAQLPPPDPKLVPMIWIAPEWDGEIPGEYGEIWISKAICEEEAFMLMKIKSFSELAYHGESDDVWWGQVPALD